MLKTICNIDTIYILVYIENYEKSAKSVLELLFNEKEKSAKNNSKNLITINNLSFELEPSGSKGYAFILRNDGFNIKISKYNPTISTFAPLQIRISSEYLWSYGIEQSWEIISSWITKTFGTIISNKVCRIDLCCHTSGVDFITDYENSYKGHFKKFDKISQTGKIINSITFGTRKGKNIYCRIYNKTLEVKETKKKSWFFNIWQQNELDKDNVWNLEFELKSEFLRSFNIVTIDDCLINLQQLWSYCTTEWLVKIDRTNSRTNRCPINTKWLDIQNAFGELDNNALMHRKKQMSLDADILIPSIIGNITSFCARRHITDSQKAFKKIRVYSLEYLSNKNKTFKSEVIEKSKLLDKKRSESYGK